MSKNSIQQAKEDAERDVKNGDYNPYNSSSDWALASLVGEKAQSEYLEKQKVYEETWKSKTDEKRRNG